jgi:hypothetical protein
MLETIIPIAKMPEFYHSDPIAAYLSCGTVGLENPVPRAWKAGTTPRQKWNKLILNEAIHYRYQLNPACRNPGKR